MAAMARTRADSLLLGEWACLGVLAQAPAHGYDVALRLAPTGDIGRVWSLSRSLTYRALDQLAQRDLIAPIAEEKGKAGGLRTILAPTKEGKAAVKRWVREPVSHIRDVRGELLLKLVLSDDPGPLLEAQRARFAPVVEALAATGGTRKPATDPVAVWRYESSRAVLRFIDRMIEEQPRREVAGGRSDASGHADRRRRRPCPSAAARRALSSRPGGRVPHRFGQAVAESGQAGTRRRPRRAPA